MDRLAEDPIGLGIGSGGGGGGPFTLSEVDDEDDEDDEEEEEEEVLDCLVECPSSFLSPDKAVTSSLFSASKRRTVSLSPFPFITAFNSLLVDFNASSKFLTCEADEEEDEEVEIRLHREPNCKA